MRRAHSTSTRSRRRCSWPTTTPGHSELCSLFLDQGFRQGKNGVLLAKSRLLFIAEFTQLFSPKIIAELRGRLTPEGKSPFWEGLGRHFFAMEYSTADYLTGIGQKSFIAELMPKHPVYVNLLSPDARDAIGSVHADTVPARTMLEQEGFRYEGYVDIFDAGPTVECFRDDIHAVRQSQVLPVTLEERDPVPDSLTDDVLWLVANRDLARIPRAGRVRAVAPRPLSTEALRGRHAGRDRRRHRARRAAGARRPLNRELDAGFQLRRHPGTDAQLLRPGEREHRVRTQRRTRRQSARSGAAGTGEDARAGRARLSTGGAAAARAAIPSGVCAHWDLPA